MRSFLPAICAVLVLASCVRGDRSTAAPDPEVAGADMAGSESVDASEEPVAGVPGELPAVTETARSVAPAQRPVERRVPVPQLPVTRNDRLSGILSEVPVSPFDFRLGSLPGPTRSGDESAMMRTGDRFFAEIRSGTISRATVYEESLPHLSRSLRPYLAEGGTRITAVRLGRPIFHGVGSAEIPIRLFGTKGDTVGLLLYRLVGNEWFVSDLHANLRHLSVPSPGRAEPFSPLDPAQRG